MIGCVLSLWLTAVCRHGLPLKAANMIKSGERYGFGHMLHTTDFAPKGGVRVVYYDVMCKVSMLLLTGGLVLGSSL